MVNTVNGLIRPSGSYIADINTSILINFRYLRCSPEVNQLMHRQNAIFNSISSMIRYFLPKKVPKFAMFGPGLETNTSKIVLKIMHRNPVFQTVGLFPGQFDGNKQINFVNPCLCH